MPSDKAQAEKTSHIKAKAAKIKTFLKANGHKAATVNTMDFSNDEKGLDALLGAHRVTRAQWGSPEIARRV